MRVVVVGFAVGLAACAVDAVDYDVPDDFEQITIVLEQQLGVGNAQVALPGERVVPGLESDPCQCMTNQCIEDWAGTNIGCDLCVTIVCAGNTAHVCTICDADTSGENGLNHNSP